MTIFTNRIYMMEMT